MCVKYLNKQSRLSQLDLSIPQGSSLGPLLFILYINDMVNASSKLEFILYADDSVIYMTGLNIESMANEMNKQLQNIYKYLVANKLTLNYNKSEFILFSKSLNNINPVIKINNNIIKQVKETKFLGVLITNKLNWSKHIKNVTLKINRINGILYLTRHLLSKNILKNIYSALVNPHIAYANILWGSTYKSHLRPLVIGQKRIIRTILFKSRYTHTAPLFNELGIFNIEQMNKYYTAMFVFKKLNNMLQGKIEFRFSGQIHDLSLRDPLRLRAPCSRTTQRQQSVACRGCQVWNKLEIGIRASGSIYAFKNNVKESLTLNISNR